MRTKRESITAFQDVNYSLLILLVGLPTHDSMPGGSQCMISESSMHLAKNKYRSLRFPAERRQRIEWEALVAVRRKYSMVGTLDLVGDSRTERYSDVM